MQVFDPSTGLGKAKGKKHSHEAYPRAGGGHKDTKKII